jgi:hypothetical protein
MCVVEYMYVMHICMRARVRMLDRYHDHDIDIEHVRERDHDRYHGMAQHCVKHWLQRVYVYVYTIANF